MKKNSAIKSAKPGIGHTIVVRRGMVLVVDAATGRVLDVAMVIRTPLRPGTN